MDSRTASRYRAHRRDGMEARYALALARHETAPLKIEWDHDGTATLPAEDTAPFVIVARIESDPSMLDGLDDGADSAEDRRRYLRSRGMPRHAAWLEANRLAAQYRDDAAREEGIVVILEATFCGQDVASDAIGSTVLDDYRVPGDYVTRHAELDIIPDMLPELLDRARDAARAMAPSMMARADADRAAWRRMAR